jgi:VWFA-related protein
MRRRPAALSLVLALSCLPLLAAAEPPRPEAGFSESIDIDVVSVEVFVSDRSGKPVAGLGREDFELRVDGRPVAITNFDARSAAAGGQPAAGAAAGVAGAGAKGRAAAREADERPLTLALFVDDMNLTPSARNPTLQLLEGFFQSGLRRQDRVLIASYGSRGVQLRTPPAGDREAVVAALRDAGAGVPHGTINTNDWVKAWQDIANAEEVAEIEEALRRLQMLAIRREGEAHHMLLTLSSFVDALAGLPGRKALLYVSGLLQVPSGDAAIKDLARRANAAGVTLYGLGAQDDFSAIYLGTDKLADFGFSPSLVASARGDALAQALQEVVGPTGGVAAVDLNRPALLLDRIRADFSSYYSLGFSPAVPHDGRRHELEVRVEGRKGLEVRFPASFTARTREELLADRTRAALLLDAPAIQEMARANPLGVRLGFERDELAAYGRRQVTMLVTLPLARVTLAPPGPGGREGKVVMFLAARDSSGHSLRMRRIVVPIHVPEGELAAAVRKSAAYRLQLELPPGESTVALGVRDAIGGRESTVATRYVAGALATARSSPPRPAAPPGAR